MIVIYGFYRFAQKRIGYRNDFCLTCKTECLAEQQRSFNCGHLFFVPLLPLGFFTRWVCPTCKMNPHYRFGSRSLGEIFSGVFGFLTFVLLLAFIVNSFHIPTTNEADSFKAGLKTMGITALVFGGIFGLILTSTLSYRDPLLSEKLPLLEPVSLTQCPFCKGNLNSSAFCDSCQVQRHDVLESKP